MSDKNRYPIVDGKVVTRSLETHIVDHCNLRCAHCCSISPFLDPWFIDPEDLRRDLELARQMVSPTWFKLVGGEPLLHPKLLQCIEVARQSTIAPIVSLTTNGILLPKMPDQLWQALDHITLSLYPKPRLSTDHLEKIQHQAERFAVELNIKRQDKFERIRLEQPQSEDQARKVFSRCWLRRRCHLLRGGQFYTCTLPIHFDSYYQGQPPYAEIDGFRLHSGTGAAEELQQYLQRSHPLHSCLRCLGGTGPEFPHRQLTAQELAVGHELES